MSKTKEELNKIKEEVEAVNEKLQELTPEELEQVNGGISNPSIFPLSLRKSDSEDPVVIACKSPFGEDDACCVQMHPTCIPCHGDVIAGILGDNNNSI